MPPQSDNTAKNLCMCQWGGGWPLGVRVEAVALAVAVSIVGEESEMRVAFPSQSPQSRAKIQAHSLDRRWSSGVEMEQGRTRATGTKVGTCWGGAGGLPLPGGLCWGGGSLPQPLLGGRGGLSLCIVSMRPKRGKCDFCFCVNKKPNPGSWPLLLRVEREASLWKARADGGKAGALPSLSRFLPFLNEMRKNGLCGHFYCSAAIAGCDAAPCWRTRSPLAPAPTPGRSENRSRGLGRRAIP